MSTEPQIQYCTTSDGVNIAYYTMGDGLPLVVTSHLLWGHLNQQPFPEHHRRGAGLGRGLQVVRYDGRGTGLSDRQPIDFGMEARRLDLEGVVDRLKLTRFALFGRGQGVPAAIAYAVRYPKRVSHLVLLNPYARGGDFRVFTSHWDSLRDASDEDWERYTLTMANTNAGFTDSESARKQAALYRESMTPESLRAFWKTLDAIDVTPLLPQVGVHTLVMHSPNQGVSFPMEWCREVASKIPDARFVTMSRQDTWLTWSDEQILIVEDFLGVKHEAPTHTPAAVPSSPSRVASAFRTILFTDIVGHTEMMQRLGDAKGRDVLRAHERITRENLKQYGGIEVKTDGDSFMASFGSVSSAVECAVALQRAFAEYSATADEPIVVRMGLNVGEPLEEDGDFFGAAVILSARIRDQAAGGEILVPEAVRHMLSGKSFTFTDRGAFELKGFADAVRLYEVVWREATP